MPKNKTYWILVADGARARILVNEGLELALQNSSGTDFSSNNRKNRDIVTDKPGRTSGEGGARHALEPRVNWHQYEKHLFAKEMAKRLNEAGRHGEFDELILVAPPQTLGELRGMLDKSVLLKVRAELGKDLTKVAVHDLPKRLGDVLRF